MITFLADILFFLEKVSSTLLNGKHKLTVADTFARCKRQLDLVLATIWSFGFEVQDKEILQPLRQQIYLGHTLDSAARTVSVSKSNQDGLLIRFVTLSDLEFMLSCSQIASLCETLSHFASVMPGARSYLRRFWRSLAIMPIEACTVLVHMVWLISVGRLIVIWSPTGLAHKCGSQNMMS